MKKGEKNIKSKRVLHATCRARYRTRADSPSTRFIIYANRARAARSPFEENARRPPRVLLRGALRCGPPSK